MEMTLEPIIEYKMTPLEGKAYKVCLQWIVLSRKQFPEYRHTPWKKGGDPRKSLLFKYAYKLVRETQGLIPDDEYRLYIKAQLDILQAIHIGHTHPSIEPMCLAGDKAWVRWKMWKRKYDNITKRQTMEDVNLDVITLPTIVKELTQTKVYLAGMCGGQPTSEWVRCGHVDMERWIGLGKVSPFYALMSPWVKKYCSLTHVNVDVELHRKSITPEVEEKFNKIFDYES